MVTNRLYNFSGSEEPGLYILGADGRTDGFIVWLKSASELTEGDDESALSIVIEPADFQFKAERVFFELPAQPEGNVVGGVFVYPVANKTGCVDFCIGGMMQKVGGLWKLIALEEGASL